MTRLSLEIEGKKVTWETVSDCPYDEDLINAFIGLMVSHTFVESGILHSMQRIVEERTPDGLKV